MPNIALPEYLTFSCPLCVEAAGDSPSSIPRFSLVAYTGGVMRIAGFPHPVVVDLLGLSIPRQDLPIRLDHKPQQGVGHTHRVVIENDEVLADGLISRETSWARDVASSGSHGFPWQASIGAAVIEADFVPHGQTVTVNHQTFTGPLHVVRKAILKEISFVDSGADPATSARIAAHLQEHTPMDETHPTPSPQPIPSTQPIPQSTPHPIPHPTSDPEPDARLAAESSPPVDSTSTVPTLPQTSTLQASGDDLPDWKTAMRQEMAQEMRRIEAIRTLCSGKYPEIEAKAIEEGWDEVHTELHVLRASRPQAPAVITSVPTHTPQVFEAVALMGSGLSVQNMDAHYAGPVLEAAEKLRGIGIQEFCELASGQRLPRFRRDAAGWLQAAFSTTRLPGILSNIANKMLLEGYNYVEDAWRQIARIASVNDFKEHTRYRMTGAFTFEKVGPGGELKHGSIDEQPFGQKADTHGIMFALTRQMIINDDMGAFTDIPRQIGMGAAEAIADALWSLWLANPLQPDGKSFFHADHKNYASGADTALCVDALTNAQVRFASQTKPNGKPLGVEPTILLVPTALRVAAELLMTSLQLNETTTANKAKPAANPHVGKHSVVTSAYLSNTSYTGASSKSWYLLADPNRLPSIEVAFLNGVDRPTVEKTDADFNTLGIQFRGFIDFGVREQDHRGAQKMAGE